jgi:hypothetical protein
MWKKCPDLRLGQLISIGDKRDGSSGPDLFNVEDEELLERIKKVIRS